jgi:putative transposase
LSLFATGLTRDRWPVVTQPRMLLPGTTYLVTQTVHDRRFLLMPSPVVNEVVLYCAFRAAAVTGVDIHWLFVHTNHIHLGTTDPSTELSAFMQTMNRLIAKCLIEHYEHTHPNEHLDAIWSRRSFSDVKLLTPNAVLQEMVYSLTNPVKDGIVRDYRRWPGVCSRPSDWAGEVRFAPRPRLFFDQSNDAWASVPYRFTVPPMLRDRPLERLIADVDALLRDEQQALCATHEAEGRSFRGLDAVLAADPFDSPTSRRPKGRTNPTVAAGGDRDMLRAGIRLVRSFRELYREAWRAYRAGARDVLFPAGTLKMRLLHSVCCDQLAAPWCAVAVAPS